MGDAPEVVVGERQPRQQAQRVEHPQRQAGNSVSGQVEFPQSDQTGEAAGLKTGDIVFAQSEKSQSFQFDEEIVLYSLNTIFVQQ